MKWATRVGCHVDRAACAWLLRRFVDPDAEFVFVDDPDDVPADSTAFDMRGVELSHHHGDGASGGGSLGGVPDRVWVRRPPRRHVRGSGITAATLCPPVPLHGE